MRGQQKHRYAIKLAANAAITVLRVDQIIMAKQAGGRGRPPAYGIHSG
jgi:chaperonin GroEL (HSP60 family)